MLFGAIVDINTSVILLWVCN